MLQKVRVWPVSGWRFHGSVYLYWIAMKTRACEHGLMRMIHRCNKMKHIQ